ncbi:AAA family ATPase [Amycolatopsis pigmentata]|uniref:AAA family ATPase n=1 Tax=Amycolatopsis pigmentata TaxID=450801 RepID=A0ABW5FLB6_9PSEU
MGDDGPRQELVRRLDEARRAKGLSQSALAHKAGLGKATVSDALNPAKGTPLPDTVDKLAKALGISGPGLDDLQVLRDHADARLRDHAAPHLRTTLPPVPLGFAGRSEELDAVLDALGPGSSGPSAVSVAGLPGVGKTALALVAAHQAQERGWFSTALFVDLLGYHGTPADPGDLLAVLLRGLDVDVSVAGSTAAERAAAYRARLAELTRAKQPVLIVADNAADAAAVGTLVPGGPHRLLVTSRHTLHTLEARLVELPALTDDAANELLATALRIANPGDARADLAGSSPDGPGNALLRLCGGLPLALRITAGLLIADPDLSIAELAEEIAELGPLEGLDDGERAVRAAIELSYRQLSSQLAEVFRLLALNPGPDLSTEAAEVLTGLRRPVLRRRLSELARAHLLDGARVPGRWRMHDLVRVYAHECLWAYRQHEGNDMYGLAAQQRLVRHYRAWLEAADVWLHGFIDDSTTREAFPDHREALAWLDTERTNLLGAAASAALNGSPGEAVRIALGLTEYLQLRNLHADAAWVLGIAEKVAPTPFERAQLLDTRGNMLAITNHFDAAIALHEQALEIFRKQGHDREKALALLNLGYALRYTGQRKEATARYREARAILERTGPLYYLASAWLCLAAIWNEGRDFSKGLSAADQALAAARTCRNTTLEVKALFNRFNALYGLQRHAEALDTIKHALSRAENTATAHHHVGEGLVHLAVSLQAAGRPQEEHRSAFEKAATAFDRGGLADLADLARTWAEGTESLDSNDSAAKAGQADKNDPSTGPDH